MQEDYNGCSGSLSVYLKTADHLNLNLSIFYRDTASFKIEISKVQDLGNLGLSSMQLQSHDHKNTQTTVYVHLLLIV